jgi:predicted LPLAT superfamily acyltransferase
VTIYHLSHLFRMPVAFSIGVPMADGCTEVHCSEIFEPPEGGRQEVLEAGYAHFQRVLEMLEGILRQQPYVWFNFRSFHA